MQKDGFAKHKKAILSIKITLYYKEFMFDNSNGGLTENECDKHKSML